MYTKEELKVCICGHVLGDHDYPILEKKENRNCAHCSCFGFKEKKVEK